jgi:hypothetical protein
VTSLSRPLSVGHTFGIRQDSSSFDKGKVNCIFVHHILERCAVMNLIYRNKFMWTETDQGTSEETGVR